MTDMFVIGYPKVGSTWLCRLLGDILDSPVGAAYKPVSKMAIATEGRGREGDYYIGHGHLEIIDNSDVLIPNHRHINPALLTDEKLIFMYRDPRDVIVSADHHWGIDNIHETIELCANGTFPIPHGKGLVNYYRMWLDSELPDYKISYETLSKSPAMEMAKLLEALKIKAETIKILAACNRQSFEKRKKWTQQYGNGLNYGKDFQLRFLRKGIVGDWQSVFDNKAIEMCDKYFGELITELGYE